MEISQAFTKIRNAINEREDQLLLNVDNEFNNIFFKEELIKQSEKLPNEIKNALELGKEIDNNWHEENKKLLHINGCIKIENNIKSISLIKENINKSNLAKDLQIKFEENEIDNYMKQIKNIGKIVKENNLCLDYSPILNDNKNYIQTLKKWINPNKNIKGELLYKLSRDGEEISKFHELCDNKGPTLTLIQTKDGNIVGIFTPLSWDIQSTTKSDKESFMFNLNKNTKYKKVNDRISIFCTEEHGPWTYSFGFRKENKMKKLRHCGLNIDIAYEKGSHILPNNSYNDAYFNLNEVEVYKIII